jgi:hypothetical protein|tara:strand:- start:1522 stop:1764 length:243 start_codon:yes stop_codon:yes gene_type:complete
MHALSAIIVHPVIVVHTRPKVGQALTIPDIVETLLEHVSNRDVRDRTGINVTIGLDGNPIPGDVTGTVSEFQHLSLVVVH